MNSNARRAPRTRSSFARRAIGLIVAVVMALGLVVPGSAAAAGASSAAAGAPQLLANPIFGSLSAKYWRYALGQPQASIPFFDENGDQCREGQSGPVFFLAGSLGEAPVHKDECVVPYGKSLFFPIINVLVFSDTAGETAESLWHDLQVEDGWKVTALRARVGSVALPGLNPRNALYRGCSGPERGCVPQSLAIQIPAGGIFGPDPVTLQPVVTDGFYAWIPPLPRGTHTIQFGGEAHLRTDATNDDDTFTQDVTYVITIE